MGVLSEHPQFRKKRRKTFQKTLAFPKRKWYNALASCVEAYAPVAQLDRVTDYESVGRGFEFLPAYQKPIAFALCFFLYACRKFEPPATNFREGTAAVERATGTFFVRLLPAYQKPRAFALGFFARLPKIRASGDEFSGRDSRSRTCHRHVLCAPTSGVPKRGRKFSVFLYACRKFEPPATNFREGIVAVERATGMFFVRLLPARTLVWYHGHSMRLQSKGIIPSPVSLLRRDPPSPCGGGARLRRTVPCGHGTCENTAAEIHLRR